MEAQRLFGPYRATYVVATQAPLSFRPRRGGPPIVNSIAANLNKPLASGLTRGRGRRRRQLIAAPEETAYLNDLIGRMLGVLAKNCRMDMSLPYSSEEAVRVAR